MYGENYRSFILNFIVKNKTKKTPRQNSRPVARLSRWKRGACAEVQYAVAFPLSATKTSAASFALFLTDPDPRRGRPWSRSTVKDGVQKPGLLGGPTEGKSKLSQIFPMTVFV